MQEKICVIDGDLLLYKVAFSCENDNWYTVQYRIYTELYNVLSRNETTKYVGFLTGKTNFRKLFYPEYKAHRKDKPKPKWFKELKEYMLTVMGFIIIESLEADDLISIYSRTNKNSIICSTDKDLLQIEGLHYNLTKETFTQVKWDQSQLNMWIQVLMGDTSDNIKGIDKIGPVKASGILKDIDCDTYIYKVLESYTKHFGQYNGIKLFSLNYQLIKLLEQSDLFDPSQVFPIEIDYKLPIENHIGKIKIEELNE